MPMFFAYYVKWKDRMIGENLLDVVDGKTDNRFDKIYAQISDGSSIKRIRSAAEADGMERPEQEE